MGKTFKDIWEGLWWRVEKVELINKPLCGGIEARRSPGINQRPRDEQFGGIKFLIPHLWRVPTKTFDTLSSWVVD